jgi:hypothetical protein
LRRRRRRRRSVCGHAINFWDSTANLASQFNHWSSKWNLEDYPPPLKGASRELAKA